MGQIERDTAATDKKLAERRADREAIRDLSSEGDLQLKADKLEDKSTESKELKKPTTRLPMNRVRSNKVQRPTQNTKKP